MTPFQLVDVVSAEAAVAALRIHGPTAQPIAAGGDLLGLLKDGVEGPTLGMPSVLVNLAGARDMLGITADATGLRLGAMTTLATLAAHPGVPPMLAEAVGRIASPQLRARTTIGGNLLQRPRCWYFRHPDVMCFKKGGAGCPAVDGPREAYPGALFPGLCHAGHPSDLAPPLIALEAEVELVGPDGGRRLPLADLYDGAGTNARQEALLGPAEILAAVLIPLRAGRQAFVKVAPRDANEFSWASAAVRVELDAGRISRARLVLGGIAPAPLPWPGAAALMLGRRLEDLTPDAIAETVLPQRRITDLHPARVAACRAAIRRAITRLTQEPR